MQVLLFGSRGMFGRDLEKELALAGYQVVGLDKEDVDVTQQSKAEDVIKKIRPDVVMNATGYTDVDGAENDKAAALALNDLAVGYLTQGASSVGAKLVHLSTEMVFDGENQAGYDEKSEPKPINVYGQSKAAGEKYVLDYERGFLVRTSWLYGHSPQRGKPRGMNFIDMIMKLSEERPEVRIINDQYGKPTSTRDLAQAINKLISGAFAPGIYHLVNEGQATWYDIAKEVWRVKGLTTPLVPITSAEYPNPARRPRGGILINNKFPALRPWQRALADYLSNNI